ncbi:FAD:protein FMN transferase [Dysosmobacter sp.]|uniref:FAD:protein FMN transferase n=1 Tax=Dysosmobacter sp. TaxID=2591382 RepID=UPI002A8A70B7|nr:FAD:protein FMN transferase [Dysosmobacter sp.]MDY3281715.1 FAD:protein FMN transferase [Dysosmobacter sp.]
MKRFSVLLLALVLALSGCARKPAEAQIFAMDTVMELTAYGSGAEKAVSQSEEVIRSMDAMLDRTSEQSEVSALNRSAGAPAAVSETLAQLLCAARDYAAATDGSFDITIAPVMDAWGFTGEHQQVPDQSVLDRLLPLVDSRLITLEGTTAALAEGQSVDLGGIAKGYVSDCVEAVFRENGVESGKISLGGNVYVRGSKPDGSAWRVGVRDPRGEFGYACILTLSDSYAVTSGGYERYFTQDGKTYHHIIDPATGYPAESGLLSVTVVADANGASEGSPAAPGNGAMCDAFSTALFVMGADAALEFWRSGDYDFDLVLVTEDSRVLVTGGLEGRFEEYEESGYAYEVIH